MLAGAAEQIADELEEWIDNGIDGFNRPYATLPGLFEDFIDGVVPILQERGGMQSPCREGNTA